MEKMDCEKIEKSPIAPQHIHIYLVGGGELLGSSKSNYKTTQPYMHDTSVSVSAKNNFVYFYWLCLMYGFFYGGGRLRPGCFEPAS